MGSDPAGAELPHAPDRWACARAASPEARKLLPLPNFLMPTVALVVRAVTPQLPQLAAAGAAGYQQGIMIAAQVGAAGRGCACGWISITAACSRVCAPKTSA